MEKEITLIRRWLVFFMVSLFVSGLTAMPLEAELGFLSRHLPSESLTGAWMGKVHQALSETNTKYPFIAYGADWLAFAHFVLAVLFIGPYRDPVRNRWVIEFGMIACLLVIPFAFIAGEIRGIPIWWRLIDCSFGIVGLLPLNFCLNRIARLEGVQKILITEP